MSAAGPIRGLGPARDDAERSPTRGGDGARIALFVLATVVLGGIVGATNAPDAWYRELAKPAWNPPDWVFGPVWTTLYAMIGYAGFRVWRRRGARSLLFRLWLAQLALNLAWTPLFFSLRSLPLASVEIAALLASVATFVVLAGARERVSAWLFVPYLAWVGFASALTWTIWSLNA